MIDILLAVIGGICVVLGIIGCVLPILPGPVLAYAGLLLFELSSTHPFTLNFMIVFAILTILVALLDYLIPVYGTKILKGTKYGIWGSAIGLIIGAMVLFPVGIILGPIIGALGGELIGGRPLKEAFIPAIGAFVGFMTGTFLKLALTGIMGYYYFKEVYVSLLSKV
jgi:hypothetical protein